MQKMFGWLRARLVADVRHFHRWWSIRFGTIGLTILSFVQFDPVAALSVWNMMPAPVRELLPPDFLRVAGMLLFALSMLARVVDQKKLKAQRDG